MIQLTLNRLPPSVNHAYINVHSKKHNRIFRVESKVTKEYKMYVKEECIKHSIMPQNREIMLSVIYTYTDNRKHDIDNLNKVLLDALEGNMYSDDNNIIALYCYKKKGSETKVEISIEVIDKQKELNEVV